MVTMYFSNGSLTLMAKQRNKLVLKANCLIFTSKTDFIPLELNTTCLHTYYIWMHTYAENYFTFKNKVT